MKTKIMMLVMISLVTFGFIGTANAEMLSIYKIQFTDEADGASPENGKIVDCLGGTVIHKISGSRPRLVIQDVNENRGWNAIQVKGWVSDAFDAVNIGDNMSFYNVLVEEYRGTTFLQYQGENNAYFQTISTGNTLPKPIMVSIKDINAPTDNIDSVIVNNHNAEKYESALIKVVNVYIEGTGYGKSYDNYLLTSNANPALTCWASDYMNSDNESIYHSYVETGKSFCSVSGILEQYTNKSGGINYDYYQLLTTNTESFSFQHVADLDGDGDVDFDDYDIFGKYWRLYEGK
ncbi:MAG: hypothetical protein JW787_11295 [Sedimentisphaerales bacterium]|nr:hypothetical protein [Sedimentisphaerales bacterium]